MQELQDVVDTLIVIPNQNLFRVANEQTTFADAFRMADEVLHSGVRGITDLMVMPGLINLDFADIRSVMSEMGKAMMGAGEAHGENRAIEAAESAISNPLLDDVSMKGARGLLINISGGPDLTLYEVDEAANRVRDEVDPTASIIFGSTSDPELEGKIRVSVFATGIDSPAGVSQRPTELKILRPARGEIDHALPRDGGAGEAAAATAAISAIGSENEAAAAAALASDIQHSDVAAAADAGEAEPQSEMFSDAAAANVPAAEEIGDTAAGIAVTETGDTATSEPAGIVPIEAAQAETARVETAPLESAPAETGPYGTSPVERPADLAQTGGRDADAEPACDTGRTGRWRGRSCARSCGPKGGGPTVPNRRNRKPEPASANPCSRSCATGARDSARLAGRAANADRGDEETESSSAQPHSDEQAESTVRLITDIDRSRREAADRTSRTHPPASGEVRNDDRSAEDDLLEIPAFLRRQAN